MGRWPPTFTPPTSTAIVFLRSGPLMSHSSKARRGSRPLYHCARLHCADGAASGGQNTSKIRRHEGVAYAILGGDEIPGWDRWSGRVRTSPHGDVIRTASANKELRPPVALHSLRESGGIGRRAGLRIQRGNPWGFNSPLSHQIWEPR